MERLTLIVQRSVLLPLLVAAALFVVVGYGAGRPADRAGDPTYFIHAGQRYLAPDMLPADSFVETATGYDGQFFFYLAQDPLLSGKAASRDESTSDHVDNVPYRYQRILLPVLGWVASAGGDPDLLQWALPLINVLAVLGATALLARFLRSRRRPTWVAIAFPASIGVLVGVFNDLSDPLAASLFLAGVVWWLEDRTAPALAALAACLLARELYIVPVLVLGVVEVARTGRRGFLWFLPAAVLGLWQLVLQLALSGSPTSDANKPSIVPLRGAIQKVREVVREDGIGGANWEILFVGLLLACCVYFAVWSVVRLRSAWRERPLARENLLPLVGLGAVLLIPFLTLDLWRNIPSYSRYAAPVAGLLVLAYAIDRGFAPKFLLTATAALSLTNPVLALLPTRHGRLVEPTPPATPAQARASQVAGCIADAGLVARVNTDLSKPEFTVIGLTTKSGLAGTVTVYEQEDEARRQAVPAVAFVKAGGGEGDRVRNQLLLWPERVGAEDDRRVRACLE